MLYDHFSIKLSLVPNIIPTISLSSSQISSIQKKNLPIATATKSETTATLQNSNKFMSWMIPNKRTPMDLATDTASISSKKSSNSAKDELISKKFDIDLNKLFEYSTKGLHTFGYPSFSSASSASSTENNTTGVKAGTASTVNAISATSAATSTANTNGIGNPGLSTVAASGTTSSTSLISDGNTGTSQKMKGTEIYEKNGTAMKPTEKER